MMIEKTIFVGGPAHGRTLEHMNVDERQVKWIDEPVYQAVRFGAHGPEYDKPPVEPHIYEFRKLVTDSRFGSPVAKRVLVHSSLIHVPWETKSAAGRKLQERQEMAAVTDALLRAFVR